MRGSRVRYSGGGDVPEISHGKGDMEGVVCGFERVIKIYRFFFFL